VLSLIECALLEEKVLYRTLKGSISATYLEPLKGSIHSLKKGSSGFYIEPCGVPYLANRTFYQKKNGFIYGFHI